MIIFFAIRMLLLLFFALFLTFFPPAVALLYPPTQPVPSVSSDDGDDEKSAPPGDQSPSARKSAAHQRRRQRKERRSTGLPGLKVTDSTATADVSAGNGDAYSGSAYRRVGNSDGHERKAKAAAAVTSRLERLRRERLLKTQEGDREEGEPPVKPGGNSPRTRSRTRFAAARSATPKRDDDDDERHRALVARLTEKLKKHSNRYQEDNDDSSGEAGPSSAAEQTIAPTAVSTTDPPSQESTVAFDRIDSPAPSSTLVSEEIIAVEKPPPCEASAAETAAQDTNAASSVDSAKGPTSLVEMFASSQTTDPTEAQADPGVLNSSPSPDNEKDETNRPQVLVEEAGETHSPLLRRRKSVTSQTPATAPDSPAARPISPSSGDMAAPLLPAPSTRASASGEELSCASKRKRPSRCGKITRCICCLGCFVAFCGLVKCWSD